MNERAQFGARLRQQREARGLTIADVSKVTKIPERSITLLEGGSFDALPGDVFVRGFLRSYSRCVGLDVEATLRDFDETAGKAVAPLRKEPSLTRPGVRRTASGESAAAAPPAASVAAESAARAGTPDEKAEEKPDEKEDDESALFSALSAAGRSTSRVSLTLAVIILVIVATLTLSLLLRRPGHVGDGLSRELSAAVRPMLG